MLNLKNNSQINQQDIRFMREALSLARSHKGLTGENPSVGCVIVKDEIIIARGVTALGGRPHAETQALNVAGVQAEGGTAYVTLEPCSHTGQTGPCCAALIEAKISRCVIAAIDPDPRVNWRGAALLQEAGVDTVIGCLAEEAANIMDEFFRRVKQAGS